MLLVVEVVGWVAGPIRTLLLPKMLLVSPLLALGLVPFGPGPLVLAVLRSRARRLAYVPFRSTPEGYGSRDFGTVVLPELRVSGKFALNRVELACIDMPTTFAVTPEGALRFETKIHFTRKIYGLTVTDQDGSWILEIAPGTLRSVEFGLLYLHEIVRPALRLSALRMDDRQRTRVETIVLSPPRQEEAHALGWQLQSQIPV